MPLLPYMLALKLDATVSSKPLYSGRDCIADPVIGATDQRTDTWQLAVFSALGVAGGLGVAWAIVCAPEFRLAHSNRGARHDLLDGSVVHRRLLLLLRHDGGLIKRTHNTELLFTIARSA